MGGKFGVILSQEPVKVRSNCRAVRQFEVVYLFILCKAMNYVLRKIR